LCLLYTKQLSQAVETLEKARARARPGGTTRGVAAARAELGCPCAQVIRADPCKALTYPAVFNLCTLYDLQGSEGAHKKQMIHSLVRQYAPDDFDVTACKL
jgi:hypothetical protein